MEFYFIIDGTHVTVSAEKEGDARYMVRMAKVNKTFMRIGYLTGERRTWMAERAGVELAQRFTSAEMACAALASEALSAAAT